MKINTLGMILKKLGITVHKVRKSRQNSLYIDSSAGLIRFSDHPQIKMQYKQKKVDVKLNTFMNENEIINALRKEN